MKKIFFFLMVLCVWLLVGCKKEEFKEWVYDYEIQEDDTYKIVKATTVRDLRATLGDIYIPLTYKDKKVTTIGPRAFMNNVGFTDGWYPNLYVGENITKIEEDAFKGFILGAIEIKENVEVIEDNAFDSCEYLYIYCFAESKPVGWSEIWNPDERPTYFNYVERRSNETFNYVVLKNNEVVITGTPFLYNQTELTDIIFPSHIDGMIVSRIANTVFVSRGYDGYNTVCIKKVVIPETITILEKGVFEHLHNLKSVDFSSENKITKIEENALYYCEALENFVLGDELVEIEENAFASCISLTSIFIPSNVTIIGKNTFKICSYLFFFVEDESKPIGWHEDWNPDDRPVVWGYVEK